MALNTAASMNCTVLSHPLVTVDMVAILFNNETQSGITVATVSDKEDRFIINLHIENVQRFDTGDYIVTVDNGIGEITILMELIETGNIFIMLIFRTKIQSLFILVSHIPLENRFGVEFISCNYCLVRVII